MWTLLTNPGVMMATAAGLSDALGGLALWRGGRRLLRHMPALMAFGSGWVLSVALIELLPGALEQAGKAAAVWAVAGFIAAFVAKHFLPGAPEDAPRAAVLEGDLAEAVRRQAATSEEAAGPRARAGARLPATVWLAIAGVVVCDYFDGLAVAGAAAAAPSVGLAVLVGLFPHNFLEGLAIAAVLVGAGLSLRGAFLATLALAGASFLGGVSIAAAIPAGATALAVGFAVGILLHLVSVEKLPRIDGPGARGLVAAVVAGVLFFLATDLIVGLVGGGD